MKVTKTGFHLATLLFAALLSIAFVSCSKSTDSIDEEVVKPEPEPETPELDLRNWHPAVPIKLSASHTEIKDSLIAFSWQTFGVMNKGNESENKVYSPLSLTTCLAMLANGVEGESRRSLFKAMRIAGTPIEECNAFVSTFMEGVADADKLSKYACANAMWYDKSLTLSDAFSKTLTDVYSCQFFPTVISKTTGDEINEWVKGKTNGLIKQIVFHEVSKDEKAHLVNATYFKSNWRVNFEKRKTTKQAFYTSDGRSTQVDMMRNKMDGYYLDDANQTMVAIPFNNDAFYMMFIMPKEGYSIDQSIAFMESNVNIASKMRRVMDIDISFPKFTSSLTVNMLDVLEECGLHGLMASPSDCRMFTNTQVALNTITHSATITVDEKGAEAAAATHLRLETSNGGELPKPIVVTLDHPFVFCIMEHSTSFPLFIGSVERP